MTDKPISHRAQTYLRAAIAAEDAAGRCTVDDVRELNSS